MTDANGNTTASYSYTAYGEASRSGSDDTLFQFTGRENDGASGLYYYRARYYSPTMQRFVSEDPIGLAGGSNVYAYVAGNPISLIDPFGFTGEPPPEPPQPSITAVIDSAIKRGDVERLRALLNSEGLGQAEAALAKRGLTRAGDLIRGGLKKSDSYSSELADTPYAEICKLASGRGGLADKARKMRKLIEQGDRLGGKGY